MSHCFPMASRQTEQLGTMVLLWCQRRKSPIDSARWRTPSPTCSSVVTHRDERKYISVPTNPRSTPSSRTTGARRSS
ncbi:hypothetical protein CEE69_20235 [Rhodopirellula bahusiensis]|uniref:Uncharacterized protein n=1 Tax=Rhodopirellula bahusiensis TaxID=2014065 RepID=A0A2G1W3B8_9BACT|nr:hypothetical protein CEE69_20235 [Rhodopirellula bahusiensis]